MTDEDYSPDQQDAWAEAADDLEGFAGRLAGQLVLVATVQEGVVAFASLQDNRKIDMLYVHPAIARQGVATMLVDALEKLATARGTAKLETDASDTARPFFADRGYQAQQRNTVMVGDEWLSNTTMTRDLSGGDKVVSLKERMPS